MFAEPLAGWRQATVRETKTKLDWALEVAALLEGRYAEVPQIILVCDNLNTHTKGAFYEAFPPERARALVRRIRFCVSVHGWKTGLGGNGLRRLSCRHDGRKGRRTKRVFGVCAAPAADRRLGGPSGPGRGGVGQGSQAFGQFLETAVQRHRGAVQAQREARLAASQAGRSAGACPSCAAAFRAGVGGSDDSVSLRCVSLLRRPVAGCRRACPDPAARGVGSQAGGGRGASPDGPVLSTLPPSILSSAGCFAEEGGLVWAAIDGVGRVSQGGLPHVILGDPQVLPRRDVFCDQPRAVGQARAESQRQPGAGLPRLAGVVAERRPAERGRNRPQGLGQAAVDVVFSGGDVHGLQGLAVARLGRSGGGAGGKNSRGCWAATISVPIASTPGSTRTCCCNSAWPITSAT